MTAGLVACQAAPQRTFATLSDAEVQLSRTVTILRPGSPLEAENDDNALCLTLGHDSILGDDWRVRAPGGDPVDVHGEVTLINGSVVHLPSRWSTGGNLCLGPDTQGPLSAQVAEIRLWSSRDIKVKGVTWVSTAK